MLGNSAILTNVCMLPLYPGLIAFLAGNAGNERTQRDKMAGVPGAGRRVDHDAGGRLAALHLPAVVWRHPALPAAVHLHRGLVLGLLMLTGRNPFARLGTTQMPVLRNPYAAAFLYGLLLGPMTLPCAGPLVISAFLLGADSSQALAGSLMYFFFFGLGFGWPLVVLPLVAQPFQRRFTQWTTGHYRLLTTVSGALLLTIGIAGFALEVAPNL